MAWLAPKTNWNNGEIFDFDVDYSRIKGNIEYLWQLSLTMYPDYTISELENVTPTGYPGPSFFMRVVYATLEIGGEIILPESIYPMRIIIGNSMVWSANDLNAIERNHLLLYESLMRQREGIKRLQFTLGGVRFGS